MKNIVEAVGSFIESKFVVEAFGDNLVDIAGTPRAFDELVP